MIHFISLSNNFFGMMDSPLNHCYQSFASNSKFSAGSQAINKAQKPAKLLYHLLKILRANENSFVLDLTSGSGSLTHVCAERNISSIAYEINQEQYKDSIRTFQRLKGKKYSACKVKMEDGNSSLEESFFDNSFDQQWLLITLQTIAQTTNNKLHLQSTPDFLTKQQKQNQIYKTIWQNNHQLITQHFASINYQLLTYTKFMCCDCDQVPVFCYSEIYCYPKTVWWQWKLQRFAVIQKQFVVTWLKWVTLQRFTVIQKQFDFVVTEWVWPTKV